MGNEGKPQRLIIDDPEEIWIEYDRQSDTLYIGFGKGEAEESALLESGIIINYTGDRLISLVIQGLSERLGL